MLMTHTMAIPNWKNRTIWTGDNLEIMRGMSSESVDLIYLDPPFNSKHNYAAPIGSKAAGAAFKDTWTLDDVDKAWWGEIAESNIPLYKVLDMARHAGGKSTMSYLIYMAVRILEMHRVLKETGSLYLHCDPTMSHYLKMMLDAVFGVNRYNNEIVWRRTRVRGAGIKKVRWVHDTILAYAKSNEFTFNRIKIPYDKSYVDKYYRQTDKYGQYQSISLIAAGPRSGDSGKPWRGIYPNSGNHWSCPGTFPKHVYKPDDWGVMTTQQKLDYFDDKGLILWPKKRDGVPRFKRYLENSGQHMTDMITDVDSLSAQAAEYLGYPTQKPLALLERLIQTSSNKDDWVLDPFCGCATACSAAEILDRNWVGIDISPKAVDLLNSRLVNEAGIDKFTKGAGILIHRTDIPIRKGNRSKNIKHQLFGKQEGRCNLCRHEMEFQHLEVDHVIPKAKGGADDDTNIQLLCGHCNRVKGKGTMADARVRLNELGILVRH